MHLISHTHWDREWHQTFQQFRLRLVHLVDGLLDILESDPAYLHYMLDGQTIVLDDYLQIRPEREADLRRHIQSGRVLVGPWYILPDEFLVSPEATARNLLEGARGAARFGPRMAVGYIPDPFGHIGQMPQILRGFGIDTACLWRGVGEQDNEFWWQSPDGSRVLMGFLQSGYFNAVGILNGGGPGLVSEAARLRDELGRHTAGQDLILMHGVDHLEPQPETSAALAYAEGKLEDARVVHSTLPAYFEQVRRSMDLGKLAVVRGELRDSKRAPMLVGVLSARMWIKQRNRACETLLERWAEPFSAFAQTYAAQHFPAAGLRDPRGALREAWRLVMQCHPHDSICGCSIDAVHDEMRPRFDQAEQIGEALTAQSLEALALAADTRQPASLAGQLASGLVVFNSSAAARAGLVEAELKGLPEEGGFELVDENGQTVAFETVGAASGVIYTMLMERTALKAAAQQTAPGGTVGGMRMVGIRASRTEKPDEALVNVRVSQTAEVDLAAWEQGERELKQLLDDSTLKNFQVVITGDPVSRVRLAARDVPGLGWRTYWVRAKAVEPPAPARVPPLAQALMPLATRLLAVPGAQKLLGRLVPDPAARPPHCIENEHFQVEAQPDGTLEILDKRSGLLCRGQNRFEDGGDRGDTYNYSKPQIDPPCAARLLGARVTKGALRQEIELRLELRVPAGLAADRRSRAGELVTIAITSRVTLCQGAERVEIHTEIDNPAKDHRLRVHFGAPFTVNEAEYDGHYEIVKRPLDLPAFDATWEEQPRPEVPQRGFTLLSDGKAGLLLANRGLPEVEVLRREGGSEVALTLLRCVGWLSRGDLAERKGPAGPELETPGAQMLGHWAFDYAIVPFSAGQRERAILEARAFETPLRGVSTGLHGGTLPAAGSFLSVEPSAFDVTTVKLAEDGHGWLARGCNLARVELDVHLKPLQAAAARRANLAEEESEALQPNPAGALALCLRPGEIATVRFL